MAEHKRGPGRPAFAREKIVQAALDIVDEEGVDALSLRGLADRLSSSTATLYRHVDGRAELVGLVVEHILRDAAPAADLDTEVGWNDACRDTATRLFQVLALHARAAPLLAHSYPAGPSAMAIRERIVGVLLRDGFAPDVAAKAMATLLHYVFGFAVQSSGVDNDPDSGRLDFDRTLGDGEGRYPSMASIAHLLPRPLFEEFQFGLDLILLGLEAERPHD